MSENDESIYVDLKKCSIRCISFYNFSETKYTAQLLTIFTACVSV